MLTYISQFDILLAALIISVLMLLVYKAGQENGRRMQIRDRTKENV